MPTPIQAPSDGAAEKESAPKGLLSRIADRLLGESKSKKAEAPRAQAPASRAEADADDFAGRADEAEEAVTEAGRVRLHGRILLHTADQLVVEITLPVDFDWRPGYEATVVLTDGTEWVVRVIARATTTAGPQAAGLTLRLALDLPLAAGTPSRITLADGTLITL